MIPIFDDYDYLELTFYEMMNGIREMIKQKLAFLCNHNWTFKGWIKSSDYQNISFELKYYDKATEESYLINGYCNIQEKLVINEATFDFYVMNERSKQYVSFKTDIEDNNNLVEIEELINNILKSNRSYRYFLEDYTRYMKQNPIHYVKDLLINHLIEIEEEIFDEGFGTTYHYTGEFGEDILEIVIDDNEDEEEYIFDFINVEVADRFHLYIADYRSEEIRSLMPLLKCAVIPVDDFLIRTHTMNCINKEHHLNRIKALVCVDDGRQIKEVAVEALYCAECDQYFISELEYEKLCEQGRICSRVITLIEYKKIAESGFHSWAEKSLLRSYGYTVNAQDNLSDIERHRILSFIIENGIMRAEEIIHFIEWLISRNSNKNFYSARLKWNRDIEYVRNYKLVKSVVRVKDIYIKKYVKK